MCLASAALCERAAEANGKSDPLLGDAKAKNFTKNHRQLSVCIQRGLPVTSLK